QCVLYSTSPADTFAASSGGNCRGHLGDARAWSGPAPPSRSSSDRSPPTFTELSKAPALGPLRSITARTPSASPMLRDSGSAIDELYCIQVSHDAFHICGNRTGAFATV